MDSRDAAGGRTDQRYYRFALSESDDGSDLGEFELWTVSFTLMFQASLPAAPEGTTTIER